MERLRDPGFWYPYHSSARRVVIATGAAFLSGALFYANIDLKIDGVPLWFLTGLIYAAIVGPAASGIFLFLPSLSGMIEAVAVSRLGLACCSFAIPELGALLLAMPLLSGTTVLAGAITLRWAGRKLIPRQ